jgi:predicted dehydrogenase
MMHFAHFHSYSYAKYLASMPGVSIMGVADRDDARAREAAERLGAPHFASTGALLREKPDAVLISSENARHEIDVLEVASAGVHVFCEKPIATTTAAARRMIDACERAGVVLQVAFPVRFSPPAVRARELVKEGSIGRVLGAATTNRGKLVRTWFADPDVSGGGAIMDHTVHVADLLRWFLADDVVEVYAESGRLFYPDLACEDAGLLSLAFKKGAFATLDTSWSRLPSYPTWGEVVMRLWGEKGTLELDAFAQTVTVWKQEARFDGWGSDCDQGMMKDFVATLRTGRKPTATGHDAMKAIEVAVAAYESVRTGKPVRIASR